MIMWRVLASSMFVPVFYRIFSIYRNICVSQDVHNSVIYQSNSLFWDLTTEGFTWMCF